MAKGNSPPATESTSTPAGSGATADDRPRRHSLPTAAQQSSPLANWRTVVTDDTHEETRRSGSSDGGGALRFLRGGRRPKSTQIPIEQAVTVRSYSLHTASEASIEEETVDFVPLPSIEEFTFDGILKAVEPKVARTLETISLLSTSYRANLSHETSLLLTTQSEIETSIKDVDRLSAQALRTTTQRTNRLKSESAPFRNGAVVEDLAKSAEKAYSTIESIIATLQAIDQMLPVQERLGREDSPHSRHYPFTHNLMAGKASRSSKSVASKAVTSMDGSSSPESGPVPPSMSRRASHFSMLSSYGPSLSGQSKRLSSPPSLKLRTVVPTPTTTTTLATPTVISPSLQNSSIRSAAIPVRERDSMSVATSAAVSARSSFSLKNIMWGGFGAVGRRGSGGSGSGSGVEGETAQAKLKRIIEVQKTTQAKAHKRGDDGTGGNGSA